MKSGSPANRPPSARCRSAYCSARVAAPGPPEPCHVMPIASGLPLRGRNYVITSMTALHEQSGIAQSRGQALLDLSCLRPRYALQVQHRPGEQLEAPAQHAACRTNPGLVLIEPIGGRAAGPAPLDPQKFPAAVALVQQHQGEVGRTPAR